jgi:hypothetical protein
MRVIGRDEAGLIGTIAWIRRLQIAGPRVKVGSMSSARIS